MNLRPHQARFLNKNPDKALLVWEQRTGKTIPAILWSEHPSRRSNAIIICMKSNKKSWKKQAPLAHVYTKEEFKKYWRDIEAPSCVVVDEADNFASPLFIRKRRSALSEALYNFIRQNPQMHVLLLTGTPLTNDPASVHTLLTYLGHYIDWKVYQNAFYTLQYKPFLPRPAYFPNKNWRMGANNMLKSSPLVDIVSLKDCVKDMPPVTHEILTSAKGKYAYEPDEDEVWQKDHRAEQYYKTIKILEASRDLRKVIVVCQYTEQIDQLAKELAKHKPVIVLDGRTKDQEAAIQEAQELEDVFFIVQAQINRGWDGYMFDCMIYASMSYRVIDRQQMDSRLTSVDHVKPLLYYDIIADGKWDKAIYKSVVENGTDFDIHHAS